MPKTARVACYPLKQNRHRSDKEKALLMQSQGLHGDACVATSPALHELWNAVGQLFSADAEFFRQLERVDEHLDCAFLEDTAVEFAAVVVPLAFAREFADGLAHVVKAVADGKGLFLFRRHTGQCRVVLRREGVALADILHNGGKRCKTSHESLSFRVLNTDGHYGIEITLTEGAPSFSPRVATASLS